MNISSILCRLSFGNECFMEVITNPLVTDNKFYLDANKLVHTGPMNSIQEGHKIANGALLSVIIRLQKE